MFKTTFLGVKLSFKIEQVKTPVAPSLHLAVLGSGENPTGACAVRPLESYLTSLGLDGFVDNIRD